MKTVMLLNLLLLAACANNSEIKRPADNNTEIQSEASCNEMTTQLELGKISQTDLAAELVSILQKHIAVDLKSLTSCLDKNLTVQCAQQVCDVEKNRELQ